MADIPAATPRSTFVTAVAWVFIVLAGFATLISICKTSWLRCYSVPK